MSKRGVECVITVDHTAADGSLKFRTSDFQICEGDIMADEYNNLTEPQIEAVFCNTTRLIQLAGSTPAEQFDAVAQNALPGIGVEPIDHASPSGFRTADDQAISHLSPPVNFTNIDTKISWFAGSMPTGPRKTRHVDRIGNHRSTVPLSRGPGTDYLKEKEDPGHRMGNLIELLEKYVPPGRRLYEWMGSLSYLDVCGLMRRENLSQEAIQKLAPAFIRGVRYLDAAARVSYRVDIVKGVLHWANRPLDTKIQKLETVFSGAGWGIWVLSPGGEFYTGSHKTGEFHHSSFLSGEPVKAAGEWQVIDGKIQYITGKTGHYRCNVNALVLALRQLAGMDALKDSAHVLIWENGKACTVPASNFMRDKALQDKCEVWGKNPMFEKVEKNNDPAWKIPNKPGVPAPSPKVGGHRPSQPVIPGSGNGSQQLNTHRNSYQPEDDDYQT